MSGAEVEVKVSNRAEVSGDVRLHQVRLMGWLERAFEGLERIQLST